MEFTLDNVRLTHRCCPNGKFTFSSQGLTLLDRKVHGQARRTDVAFNVLKMRQAEI